MKKLSRTCAVVALSMALAVSAFAGQIHSPGAPSPPPPPSGSSLTSVATTAILTIISLIR